MVHFNSLGQANVAIATNNNNNFNFLSQSTLNNDNNNSNNNNNGTFIPNLLDFTKFTPPCTIPSTTNTNTINSLDCSTDLMLDESIPLCESSNMCDDDFDAVAFEKELQLIQAGLYNNSTVVATQPTTKPENSNNINNTNNSNSNNFLTVNSSIFQQQQQTQNNQTETSKLVVRNYCKKAHNQPLQPASISGIKKIQKNQTLLFIHAEGPPAFVSVSISVKGENNSNKNHQQFSNNNILPTPTTTNNFSVNPQFPISLNDSPVIPENTSATNNNDNNNGKCDSPQLLTKTKRGIATYDQFVLSSPGEYHKVELQPKYTRYEGHCRPTFVIDVCINGALVYQWECVVYHRSTRVKYPNEILELSIKSDSIDGKYDAKLTPFSDDTKLNIEVSSCKLDLSASL